MMRFRSTAILMTLAMFLLATSAHATPGSTWLELGPGARAAALGEAVTAAPNGATAAYWNPAAVGQYGNSLEVMLADSWVEGGTIQYAAGSFDLGRVGIGFQAHYVGVSDLDLRDGPSASPIGSYDARNMALGGVIAYEDESGVRVGLGVKYLSEQIYVYDANGWAIDVGLLRHGLLDNRLDVGLAGRHLGQMAELRNEGAELPATFAAGARWHFDDINGQIQPAVLVETRTVNQQNTTVTLGTELNFLGYLAGRAAYTLGHDSRGLSVGLGVMYKGIRFDLAYVPYSNDLGNETRYSLGTDW